MEEILSLQDLSKYYTSAQSVVVGLDKLSLSFSRGEFVAITGESGSGKSSLAHVLGGILPYEGGEMLFHGKPTSHYDSADWERWRRSCVSFISQSYGILPGSSVLGNVVSALRLAGMPRREARAEAESILRRVELWEYRSRRAAKLSSGQKQRLSIARALAKPAPILIADEPTGNLDGENSARVIELLAEAARERLVILISHEFSECAHAVSRHIVLRDGRVVMDSHLREAPAPGALPRISQPSRKGLGAHIAALQLGSRPVWSAVMLLLFTLTAFGLFAFAGTFIANLDDTFTRKYDDSAFKNGDERRIVVTRADGGDMTASDEAALLSIDHVEALESYSYVRDVSCAYRLDYDYSRDYFVTGGGTTSEYSTDYNVQLVKDKMSFMQTVPSLSGGREFLTEGRLPENVYEVVSADPTLLGRTIDVFIQDQKNWAIGDYVLLPVTVVGLTDYGSGLYFHDDLGNMLLSDIYYGTFYLPSSELEGNEMLFEKNLYNRYKRYYVEDNADIFSLKLWDLTDLEAPREEMLCVGWHESSSNRLVMISWEYYQRMSYTGSGDQISLTVTDYAYTDRVLQSVREAGYAAISPYQEGSTTQIETKAEQRMQTLRICCIAFLALWCLSVLVLRAMFSLETESYRLLANIGLDCRCARRSLMLQVLLFALGGLALGLGAVFGCAAMGVESVIKLLHYLTPPIGAVLAALYMVSCLAGAIWSSHGLKKQVYPSSGSAPDLDWDEYEEVSL